MSQRGVEERKLAGNSSGMEEDGERIRTVTKRQKGDYWQD